MEIAHAGQPADAAFLLGSCRLALLDEFRVPYDVAAGMGESGLGQLRGNGVGPSLLWARDTAAPPVAATLLPRDPDGGIVIFARILRDQDASNVLGRYGGHWTRSDPILDVHGDAISSVWIADDGSVFLPFDPDEVVRNYRTERYSTISNPSTTRLLKEQMRRVYYLARPVVPRSAQIWARRRFARIQERAEFPRWPTETAMHELVDFTFRIVSRIAGAPLPRLAAWPEGRTWALVLTHDVETAAGYAAVEPVLSLERRLGLRSAWFYVPRRYDIDIADLRRLTAEGLEVGVHGLYHDGRSCLVEAAPQAPSWNHRGGAKLGGGRLPGTRATSTLGVDAPPELRL